MEKDFSYLDLHPGKFGYIYKISNNVNDKLYVGQSVNITRRFDEYRRYRFFLQVRLYGACKKYGIENFTFTVIDHADNIEELNKKEIAYIKEYKCTTMGYNCKEGGLGGCLPNSVRMKISKSNRGLKRTIEQRIAQSILQTKLFLNEEDYYYEGKKIYPICHRNPKNEYEKLCLKMYSYIKGKNKFYIGIGKDENVIKLEKKCRKHTIPEYFDGRKIIARAYSKPKDEYEMLCKKKSEQKYSKDKYKCNIIFKKIGRIHIIPEIVEGKKVEAIGIKSPKNDWEYCCKKLYGQIKGINKNNGIKRNGNDLESAVKKNSYIFKKYPIKDFVDGIIVEPKRFNNPKNEWQLECERLYRRNQSKKDFCKKRGLDKYPD